MNIRTFTTDQTAHDKGRWFVFEDGEDKTRFLIAAHMNPEHAKLLAKMGKRNQAAVRKQDQAALERMAIEAMAETILLDWEGVHDDGKPLQATKENKIRVLTQAKIVREWVSQMAQDQANFLAEQEAADTAALKSESRVDAPVGE